MNQSAMPFLAQLIASAMRLGGEEIRLASAAIPIVIAGTRMHSLVGAQLRLETILALHHACLEIAKCPALASLPEAAYAFHHEGAGEIRCQFKRLGEMATLSLFIDRNASAGVEVDIPIVKPELSAQAETRLEEP